MSKRSGSSRQFRSVFDPLPGSKSLPAEQLHAKPSLVDTPTVAPSPLPGRGSMASKAPAQQFVKNQSHDPARIKQEKMRYIERFTTLHMPPDEHGTPPSRTQRVIAQMEHFSTVSIRAMKHLSLIDDLGTVPVASVQGIKEKSERAKNLKWRIAGLFFFATAIFYLIWLANVLNKNALWLSLPYFLVSIYTTLLISITIFNNWRRVIPQLVKLPKGREPMVAVLIPTYGEPVEMVQITIESVLRQEWPQERMLILIGDDSHRNQVKEMVEKVRQQAPLAQVHYFEPPRKGTPQRKGSAKDGNLNSMLDFVVQHYPQISFIETRDADDLIGNENFLRYAIGYLQQNPSVSYVQSIKDTLVSKGDPFGNRQSFFYRGVMQARHATNAIFPCGSGLVWRTSALGTIGGFPTWNLVEDLYSGYVAMQHGLKGAYLPIVGAVGQSSPEDIPNVYKQLGTWALDTVRLWLWKNPWFTKGLTFSQRMQFTELCMFYLFSIPLIVFAVTVMVSLFTGIHPFVASNVDYVLHFWLYAIAVEVLLSLLGGNTKFEEIWRAREIWFGMLFVFAKAICLALFYGPRKKPAYKVTRKVQQVGFYFREVLFQILLFLAFLAAIIINILTHKNFLAQGDFGSIFWAVLYMFLLSGIISKSWFGLKKGNQ